MELWKRQWDIQIGTLRVRGDWARDSLDASFEISKDITRTPNKATVRVFNLSSDHRRSFEEGSDIRVIVRAGYEDDLATLFNGTAYVAESRRRRRRRRAGRVFTAADSVDIVTTVEAQDGGNAFSDAQIQRSFGAGTSLIDVMRYVIDAMQIGEGNLTAIGIGSQIYTEGTVVSGRAWRELDRLVRSAGLTWSVQDGVLQLLRGSTPLRQTAVRLSPETGLVGSPAVDIDDTVAATALLIPGLTPGRQVVLQSAVVDGSFRIKRVTYRGATSGQDWYGHLTLERY